MHALDLTDKHVVVIGLGITGRSCVRFLNGLGAKVTALDSRHDLDLEIPAKVILGSYPQAVLESADLVVVSPGVNPALLPVEALFQKNIEIIGDVELFARVNQVPVIAITGSNGKSTVTTLVTQILQTAGLRCEMGGNIGKPVLELLQLPLDVCVLELSSFQLETVQSLAPVVATVLNVSDDHLDRHGDLSTYQAIKQSIYRNSQYQVINRNDSLTWPLQFEAKYSFGLDHSAAGFGWQAHTQMITLNGAPFIDMTKCSLMGTHNVLNIQAAAMCALLMGASADVIRETVETFCGLPHRFETVLKAAGVTWINDSKATNVGATLAALEGLRHVSVNKLILIAGGEGKGADFTPLQPALNELVGLLIVIGKDGDKLAALHPMAEIAGSLEEAVAKAHQAAEVGDVVLLSPACASLDMFTSYQQRGECFIRAVEGIAA